VELVPYADEHLGLTEALECDPEMMRELGGATDPAEIPDSTGCESNTWRTASGGS